MKKLLNAIDAVVPENHEVLQARHAGEVSVPYGERGRAPGDHHDGAEPRREPGLRSACRPVRSYIVMRFDRKL